MSEHKERLAVSIADLDRVVLELRVKLLAGKLDLSLSNALRHAGQHREEEVPAVTFCCDLLTAATICDVLRSNDRKNGDQPTRVFICKDNKWSRITLQTQLTVVIDHKVKLNPSVFPDARVIGPPPPAKALFGRK